MENNSDSAGFEQMTTHEVIGEPTKKSVNHKPFSFEELGGPISEKVEKEIFPDDGSFFEESGDSEIDPIQIDRQPIDRRERAEKMGKAFATKFNLLVSVVGQGLGGQPRQTYKLQSDELEDLKDSAADYFETVDVDVSPGLTFLLAIVIVSYPTYDKIMKDRENKKESERLRIAREKIREKSAQGIKPNEKTQDAELINARREVAEEEVKNLRKQFDIDDNNYYKKTKTGGYLKIKERVEVASAQVVEITASCRAQDPEVAQSTINHEICKELYGSGYDK